METDNYGGLRAPIDELIHKQPINEHLPQTIGT